MDDFIAYTSRRRTARLIAISSAFVAIGVWMAGLVEPLQASHPRGHSMTEVWGWFSIVFFGACAVAGAKQWWDNGERLRINASGIKWSSWSDQTVPWSEIIDVTEWHHKRSRFIMLRLRSPSQFSGRGFAAMMRWGNRALTGGDMGISLTGTDRSFEDAMFAIERFRP